MDIWALSLTGVSAARNLRTAGASEGREQASGSSYGREEPDHRAIPILGTGCRCSAWHRLP